MKISSQKLIGLTVETESGCRLGKIEGFDLDTNFQSILEYKIKPTFLVKKTISSAVLIISRGQVIDINDKKMIVEDLVITKKSEVNKKNRIKQKATSSAMVKEYN